jgi:hypothetical protein
MDVKTHQIWTAITLSFCIALFSCRKAGLEELKPILQVQTDNNSFFTRHVSADPTIIAARQFVLSQDEKFNFSKPLSEKIGTPFWNKALIYGKSIQNEMDQSLETADSIIIYIPFARDNERNVNAALAIKIKDTDTSFRMLYNWEYRQFDANNSSGWSPQDVFHIFSLLERSVFATTNFRIIDPILLPAELQSQMQADHMNFDSLDVNFTLLENLATESFRFTTLCNSYTYCIKYKLKAFRGSGAASTNEALDQECEKTGSYTTCATYWIEGPDDPMDPPPPGGSGSGGGSGWIPPPPHPCPIPATTFCDPNNPGWVPGPVTDQYGYYYDRIDEMKELLEADPFFLVDPCNYLTQFKSLGNYPVPQVVTDRITSLNQQFYNLYRPYSNQNAITDPYVIKNVNDGAGLVVNCDYFPIHITQLPTINSAQMSTKDLFDYFRKNMNSFVDNGVATFEPYSGAGVNDTPLWLSSNPVGSLLHLDMANDGTVIVSGFQNSSFESKMIVTTLYSPLDADHPVSGNRAWGIMRDVTNGGYTFYTTGVDRMTTSLFDIANNVMELVPGVSSGFDDADQLWRSLQDKMIAFIEQNGGHAVKYDQSPDITFRPPWYLLKEYLQEHITLEQLKHALGCP